MSQPLKSRDANVAVPRSKRVHRRRGIEVCFRCEDELVGVPANYSIPPAESDQALEHLRQTSSVRLPRASDPADSVYDAATGTLIWQPRRPSLRRLCTRCWPREVATGLGLGQPRPTSAAGTTPGLIWMSLPGQHLVFPPAQRPVMPAAANSIASSVKVEHLPLRPIGSKEPSRAPPMPGCEPAANRPDAASHEVKRARLKAMVNQFNRGKRARTA